MKTIFLILLCATAFASAQNSAVTKNATTNELNGNLTISANRTFTVNGTLTTSTPSVGLNTASPLIWAGVTAQASVQASSGKHGLIVRAPAGTANAIIGWSSSGAVAGKFYQDTSYTAPAVYVGRADTDATIPTLQIGAATGDNAHTALAITPPSIAISPFKVTYGGAITGSSLTLGTGNVSAGNISALAVNCASVGATGTISGSNHPANVVFRYTTVAPNSSLVGNPGDICIQVTTGTATLHIKQTGTGTNTGWVAK